MLDRLRTPFFLLAVVFMVLAVIIEIGSASKLQAVPQAVASVSQSSPGKGIISLAFLDGILLYNALLMGLSLIVPERIQGRVQGIVSFLFSLLLIIGAFILLMAVFQLVILMVTLLLAPIFGTLAYFACFGFFNTGAARVTLGMVMTLKLLFAGSLVLAHQRFLQNKGLMCLIACSLLATYLLELLHAIVPGFLVSITDGIGALIALVLALIWGVLLLISSIISIVKAIL